jgi:hypothetical protein
MKTRLLTIMLFAGVVWNCPAFEFSLVAVPPPVELISPATDSSTYMIHPHFKWTEDAEADRYEIQIALDENFADVTDFDSVPVPRYVPFNELPVASTCWWRVRYLLKNGSASDWSTSRKLTINDAPNLYTVFTNDSISVITNTIAAAVANTPSTIVFEAGVYNLDLPDGAHLFNFSGVRDLQIDGNLSTVNLRNPDSGFSYFDGCEDILLRRFNVDSVDYLSANEEPVTHTAGSVVSVRTSDASFVFEPLPGYLPPDDSRIAGASSRQWGSLMDTHMPGRLKDNVSSWYDFKTQVDSLGNNQYRLYLADAHAVRIKYFAEGDVFVKSASYAKYVMRADKSTDITYESITSYGGSGNHFIGQWNDGIHFLGCASRVQEGRFVSNPCGGYVGYSFLTGFWVEDCLIEGMLDDPFNCVNKPMNLYDKVSSNTFRVYNLNPAPMLTVGQHLTLYTPSTGQVGGPFEVTDVAIESAGSFAVWRVTVNGDIGDVAPGQGSYDSQFFIDERNHPYTYIRNSTFQNSRGNCHFRSSGGVMENNNIVNLSDVALRMKYYIGGGWNVRDVRITGNTIEGCGYHSIIIAQNLAAIDLAVSSAPGTNCTAMTHQNIEICGNTIVRQRKGISVANTQDAWIEGNTLINVDTPIVVDAASTAYITVNANEIITE